MDDRDLRNLERRTFRTVTDDGLWDVMIAAVCAMFAIAPLLSGTLGDFWSSALFVPVWLAVYLMITAVRHRIVVPRVGRIRFGPERRRLLRRVATVVLIVNLAAAAAGLSAAIGVRMEWFELGDGLGFPIGLGLVALLGMSAAALVLGIPRYGLYGLLLAAAPLVGEWLWRNDLAAHHGYPVTFGIAAIIILTGGIIRLSAVLRTHPLPPHPATV